LIKGNYPYILDEKETRLLIFNENDNSKNYFNYIVSIKGIEFEGKKVILLLKKELV